MLKWMNRVTREDKIINYYLKYSIGSPSKMAKQRENIEDLGQV